MSCAHPLTKSLAADSSNKMVSEHPNLGLQMRYRHYCSTRYQADNAQAEARQSILSQILLPEAADRLGRIRLVKESRAADVENRLIMLARTGQLRQKVTEEQLKDLLNAMAEHSQKEENKIVVSRRKGGWVGDDEDDDDLLNL